MRGNFLAYIGPEVIMPIFSFLAAVAGVLLIGWRWVVKFCVKGLRILTFRGRASHSKSSTGEEDV